VSIIISIYTGHMKFVVSLTFFWFYFVSFYIYGCMLRMLLFNFADYIF